MESYRITNSRDCLILSVGKFETFSNRNNAEIDARRLRDTFERLGFNCVVKSGFVTLAHAQETLARLEANQRGKDRGLETEFKV